MVPRLDSLMPGWRLVAALVATVTVVFLSAGEASAQQPVPTLTIRFHDRTRVGDAIEVVAGLQDPASNPISGAEIEFSVAAEFLNVAGRMVVGRSVTDENGEAAIVLTPRIEGTRTVRANFAGNSVFAASGAAAPLEVASGPELYREFTPIRVPGANKWMVFAVLLTVWTIYLIGMFHVWRIARMGSRENGARVGR